MEKLNNLNDHKLAISLAINRKFSTMLLITINKLYQIHNGHKLKLIFRKTDFSPKIITNS